MRFNLDGLDVFFPYDYIYREQYDYMLELKRALDDKGHVLLEMPTGTGKTVCLISLITSYQFQHKQTGKLIYCTRTVPEMTKCMEEIKKVIAYRASCIGPEGDNVLALCLSSRRNMCVHDRVMEEGDRDTVDTECRKMTASWVRNRALNRRGPQQHIRLEVERDPAEQAAEDDAHHELCEYYENYFSDGSHAEIPRGIYSLDDLRTFGKEKRWCPYFMTRHLIHHASILVYNYQYMLDPKVANIVSKELEAESIVVFDEAHNIDNVCIEALSVTLDRRMMDAAQRSIGVLSGHVSKLKAQNDDRLRREAQELVRGLAQQRPTGGGAASSSSGDAASAATVAAAGPGQRGDASSAQARLTAAADAWLSNPVLSRDLLDEAVPGSIRKAEHFLSFMRQVVQYLRSLLNADAPAVAAAAAASASHPPPPGNRFNGLSGAPPADEGNVYEKTPTSFLHQLQQETGLDRKSLKFTYLRLNLLLRTLEMTSLEDFAALSSVCNFATLVATYLDGFAIVFERLGRAQHAHLLAEPLLQLVCLDASIAIAPVFERFRSVVITSGTLSPIDLYPRLLNFRPVVKRSLPMSTFRSCLLPLVVSRGSDQTTLSSSFTQRQDDNVIRNYGQLLLSIVRSVPDGVCGFFTSYSYMEHVIQRWNDMGLLTQILAHKLIYLETKDVVETTFALDNFRRANDCGRGAVFLSIARGKVAEGIDFDRHYGRCVVLFGIPYQYTLSQTLRARLRYLRDRYQIRDHDFLTFDALRQAAQCVGRVLRSKTDYGIVVLADARYGKADKRSRLPLWVQQFLLEHLVHLSADVAVDKLRGFLKDMGQDIETAALRSILLSAHEVKRLQTQAALAPPLQPLQPLPLGDDDLVAAGLAVKSEAPAAAPRAQPAANEDDERLYDAEGDAVLAEMARQSAQPSQAAARSKPPRSDSDDDSDDDAEARRRAKRPRFTVRSSAPSAATLTAAAAAPSAPSAPAAAPSRASAWQTLVNVYRTTLFAGGDDRDAAAGAVLRSAFERVCAARGLPPLSAAASASAAPPTAPLPLPLFSPAAHLPQRIADASFAAFHRQLARPPVHNP